MSIGTAVLLAVAILMAGGIAFYILVISPAMSGGYRNSEMIIPLAEIAPIWTQHNKEITPLSTEEIDPRGDTDQVDILWNAKTEIPETPATAATAQNVPQPPITSVPSSQPAPAAISQTKPELKLSDLEKPLRSIWDDCIQPHKETIKSQGAEEVIMDLLRMLEKHGHCPSVVIDSRDDEANDLITVRDNLAKVTLRDHTYAVCRNMVSNMKKNMMDSESMIPGALVMALGHDIGKIPEFRTSGAYNAKDHAMVGANKLMEMLQGKSDFWAKKVIAAVREHHSPTKDDQTSMLKQADRQARQLELAAHTRSYQIKPFDDWFDLKEYLTKYIAPAVNVDKTGKWNAFSFKGTIYAKPDWMLEQARRMCRDKHILDMTFIYDSEKESATRMVVSALRKENLTPLIAENHSGRKFDIRTSVGVRKLTALFLTAFTIPDYVNATELESRKVGFTEIIDAVKPLS